MKKTLLMAALLLGFGNLAAQNTYIAPVGVVESAGGLTVSQPHTLLSVDVTATCERIIAGPYARYAQKYLGSRAPLSDKLNWSITSTQVALADPAKVCYAADPEQDSRSYQQHADLEDEFPRFPIDKVNGSVVTLEDAARNAAETIFSLRRHRIELITGEAGENVFGEGLKAALDEIARLEQRYLELFLGKVITTTTTHRYLVYPESNKKQYVVCRFTAADGLLPVSDLSGEPVVLQIDPTEPSVNDLAAKEKEAIAGTYRVAAPSICKVIYGSRDFDSVILPIYEFGRDVAVAAPKRK